MIQLNLRTLLVILFYSCLSIHPMTTFLFFYGYLCQRIVLNAMGNIKTTIRSVPLPMLFPVCRLLGKLPRMIHHTNSNISTIVLLIKWLCVCSFFLEASKSNAVGGIIPGDLSSVLCHISPKWILIGYFNEHFKYQLKNI